MSASDAAAIEVRVIGLRWQHRDWGPDRIRYQLAREGAGPVECVSGPDPYGLLDPAKRRRKRRRGDFRRWERGRAMELWQMDVMGGVHLCDGSEVKVVTGIDDHSRFVVCAQVVARATAGPVCAALQQALRVHGVPEQILTDIQTRCRSRVLVSSGRRGEDLGVRHPPVVVA